MDSTIVFAILIAVTVLIGIVGLIIYKLKVSDTFPFKKMRDKDIDSYYDLSYRKSNTKKK